MDAYYDYKKFIILYVDDEEKSLKNFTRAFGSSFRILTASNAKDGFALLDKHKDEIGVLMTDQRMPGEQGVWLLERARQLQPRITRMLVTAFTDMDAAIAARPRAIAPAAAPACRFRGSRRAVIVRARFRLIRGRFRQYATLSYARR